MVDIMETLECIENKKLSESSINAVMYDEAGNPEDALPSAEQRAKDLFEALDRDKDGVISGISGTWVGNLPFSVVFY